MTANQEVAGKLVKAAFGIDESNPIFGAMVKQVVYFLNNAADMNATQRHREAERIIKSNFLPFAKMAKGGKINMSADDLVNAIIDDGTGNDPVDEPAQAAPQRPVQTGPTPNEIKITQIANMMRTRLKEFGLAGAYGDTGYEGNLLGLFKNLKAIEQSTDINAIKKAIDAFVREVNDGSAQVDPKKLRKMLAVKSPVLVKYQTNETLAEMDVPPPDPSTVPPKRPARNRRPVRPANRTDEHGELLPPTAEETAQMIHGAPPSAEQIQALDVKSARAVKWDSFAKLYKVPPSQAHMFEGLALKIAMGKPVKSDAQQFFEFLKNERSKGKFANAKHMGSAIHDAILKKGMKQNVSKAIGVSEGQPVF